MSDDNTFTCDMCGQTFNKGRSDEEAMAEARQDFGEEIAEAERQDDVACVCTDCFNLIMGRTNQ